MLLILRFAICLVIILFQDMPTAYCIDEQVQEYFYKIVETKLAIDKFNDACFVLTQKLQSLYVKSENNTLSSQDLDDIVKYKEERLEKNKARNHHLKIWDDLIEKESKSRQDIEKGRRS